MRNIVLTLTTIAAALSCVAAITSRTDEQFIAASVALCISGIITVLILKTK